MFTHRQQSPHLFHISSNVTLKYIKRSGSNFYDDGGGSFVAASYPRMILPYSLLAFFRACNASSSKASCMLTSGIRRDDVHMGALVP